MTRVWNVGAGDRGGPLQSVLLSGGLDSATVLALVRAQASTEAVFVDYGQAPATEERACAVEIARHLDVPFRALELSGLTIGSGEIPGRNLLLLSLALTARSGRPGSMAIGIHAGTPYWDCGDDFAELIQRLLDGYAGGAVQLSTPFLHLTKADVSRLAHSAGVPRELTYSCEFANGPCHECVSCLDRREVDAAAA